MEQFEQLLTCAICLDRYKNPKLLPCQHSFCMEPCMDGLVDYVRRQVKCPECRAEHRIPYQGVQGYPTNVTLQRFLELHIEITGELPDPTSGQIMKRCGVCSEKAYCTLCLHCDKEICPECKSAHKDILKREISRINNQIRRALHRLEDMLSHVEKNMVSLQHNCTSVSEEIEELYARLNKALKDRTEYLRNEIDKYSSTENKNLSGLKENLEVEISNIRSNCDLADKYMQTELLVDWDDCELMDAKEIFLKTVEFIRYFEAEPVDYNRRAKFIMAHDPNLLVTHVSAYGDFAINSHPPFSASLPSGGGGGGTGASSSSSSSNLLQPPGGPGLMRSKSDHRLTSQYHRQQDDRGYDTGGGDSSAGRISPLGGRKFGERYASGSRNSAAATSVSTASGIDRYGRAADYGGADYDSPYDNDSGRTATSRSSRLRSRFGRYGAGGAGADNADSDTDVQGMKSVRFSDAAPHVQHARDRGGEQRERVLDTEDVAKGPLSGITRLYDSPRVMKRIQESENKVLKKEKEQQQQLATSSPSSSTIVQQQQTNFQSAPTGRRPSNSSQVCRQISEEDEISRIKRQNKGTASSGGTTTDSFPDNVVANTVGHRVSADRMGSVHRSREDSREERNRGGSSIVEHSRKTPAREAVSSEDNSEGNDEQESSVPSSSIQQKSQRNAGKIAGQSSINARRPSASSDIMTQKTGGSSGTPANYKNTVTSQTGAGGSAAIEPDGQNDDDDDDNDDENEDEEESSSSTSSTSESETESEEEEEEEEEPSKSEPIIDNKKKTSTMEKTDIGPLLARSAQARDAGNGNGGASSQSSFRTPPASNRDEAYTTSSSRYNTNSYPYSTTREPASSNSSRGTGGTTTATTTTGGGSGSGGKYLSSRTTTTSDDSSTEPKPRFTSRFLNKNKSAAMMNTAAASTSAASSIDENEPPPTKQYASGNGGSGSSVGGGRDRYVSFKDRKSRLTRSKSTHGFGNDDLDDADDNATAAPIATSSSYYPASYHPSKSTGPAHSSSDLTRSRSTHHMLKSRENSPEYQSINNSGTEKDGSSLSSWARYLKNKYGSRSKDGKDNGLPGGTSSPTSSAAMARRLSLGLPLRHNSSNMESSDDDQKNMIGSPNSPTANTAAAQVAGFTEVGTTLRSQYMQKRQLLFKIGSRGSEPGHFTWPRGIAVGPDNSIVVADSSNHRVQVFDSSGRFLKEFGSYGNKEGEFDCLAGIAVNRIGQFIISDRYNHRIQVLDPSGRFLRSFGSQGTADGKFNYPWGITTDALGFIYVCDKENHRVQVFQSDGTFVGKFGSCGNKIGQLEHPHYIAVSNTNRVIVSDSNNHRVQIYDVNGRVLSSIGTEGSANGQFKFPRGIAVDDQGYILVGDSGNNRIQIFHPDGTFLRAFGCWGSADGEFKGLEGIAVMSNGNILICDRENHRIQAF